MQTLRSIVLSTICFIPTISMASDVGYQLNDNLLKAIEEPKTSNPFTVKITDRTWEAAGVEEATNRNLTLEEPEQLATTYRIEPAPNQSCHASYCMDYSKWQFTTYSTHWIQQTLLPRTRETFRSIDEHEKARYAYEDSDSIVFVY